MIARAAILLIAIGLWPVWQVVFDPATDWKKGNPVFLLVWTVPFVVPGLLLASSKASMALAWLIATVPVLLYSWIWFRALPDSLYGIVWIIIAPIACLLVVGPGGLLALLIIRRVRLMSKQGKSDEL